MTEGTKKVTKTKRPRSAKQKANEFKKGNKMSVGYGRPKMSKEQKLLNIETRTHVTEILQNYLLLTKADLNKIYRSTRTPALDKAVVKAILKVVDSGDQGQLDWFLNHILGKQKETTNINLSGKMENNNNNKNSVDLSKLSAEELLFLKKIAEKSEQEKEDS